MHLKAVDNCLICISVFRMTFNVSPILGEIRSTDTAGAVCVFCGKTIKIRQRGKHVI